MSDVYSIPHNELPRFKTRLPAQLLAGCLQVVPAALFLAFMVRQSSDDDAIFIWMGAFFFVASLFSWFMVWHRNTERVSRQHLFGRLVLGSAVAWGCSLVLLGCLSMTPLYFGRANGDGSNGTAECILMVVMFAFTFTPLVVMFATLTSFLASRLHHYPCGSRSVH